MVCSAKCSLLTNLLKWNDHPVFYCVFCSGHPHSYYQKALLSNGVTSALRLHQRVPNFQFSREYLGRLFLEDSAHYLFYSLIFVTGAPVSSILVTYHDSCK